MSFDLNQLETEIFKNLRTICGEKVVQATKFYAVGHLHDLMGGIPNYEKNTFKAGVDFVATFAEVEALTKNTVLSYTTCFAPSPEKALAIICERNEASINRIKSFVEECGSVFTRGKNNGIVLDHYVEHYPQPTAA
jgi:hypothetical protein